MALTFTILGRQKNIKRERDFPYANILKKSYSCCKHIGIFFLI